MQRSCFSSSAPAARLVAALLAALFAVSAVHAAYDANDEAALRGIATVTFDPSGNLNWNTEPNQANWTGVGWDSNILQRVEMISASGLGLSGTVDFSAVPGGLTALEHLDLSANSLTGINLSANTALSYLLLSMNNLTAINLSDNTALTHLYLGDNKLSAINLSKNTALTTLQLSDNNLRAIDLSKNTALTSLNLAGNKLATINLSKNTALTDLNLSENSLTAINLSANKALTELHLNTNNLSAIDLSENTKLTMLGLNGNNLTAIDLTANTELTDLSLSNNHLTTIDLTANTKLTSLQLRFNHIPLSRLAPIAARGIADVRFGIQYDVLFKNKQVAVGETIDLSSEAVLNGQATVFSLADSAYADVTAAYTESGGLVAIDEAGEFHIKMENVTIVNSGQWSADPAVAYTGLVRVTGANAFGLGLGSPSARNLTRSLYNGMLTGGLSLSPEFDAMVENIKKADGEAGKLYVINQLHGESLAGGMDAVARLGSGYFREAVYGAAGRRHPFEQLGENYAGAPVSAWAANASLAGDGRSPYLYGGGVSGLGGIGSLSSHKGYLGYDMRHAGAFANLDRWVSRDVVVGGAFGAAHTKLKWDEYGTKTNGNTLSGALYASARRGCFTLSGQALLGYADVNATRGIPSAGLSASSDYHLWWFGGGLRGSYRFETGSGIALTPSVGLDYLHSRSGSFTERNAGSLNLSADRQNRDHADGYLEVEASKTFRAGCATIRPSLRAGVLVQLADRHTSLTTRFRGEPDIAPFRNESSKLSRARFTAGAGVDIGLTDRLTVEVDYALSLQSHYRDHALRAGLAVSF